MFLRLLQEMSSFSNTFASSAHGSWIPLSCQSVFNGAMLSLLGSMSYCLIPEKVLLSRMIEVGHWENCLFCKLFLGCLYLEQIECLEHITGSKPTCSVKCHQRASARLLSLGAEQASCSLLSVWGGRAVGPCGTAV